MIRRYLPIILVVILIISGCGRGVETRKKQLMMDTIVNITINTPDKKEADMMIKYTLTKMERVAKLLNSHNDVSETSFINNSASGRNIKISEHMAIVINKAMEISRLTKGAFDITVLPLIELWDLYKEEGALPPQGAIENTLARVGSENITLKGMTSLEFAKDGVKIDLSGITKGFAVDEGIRALKSIGVESALIDAGGDLYCMGDRPNGIGWRIGIRHPRKRSGQIGYIIIKDVGIATSGDYEKFFMHENKRYSHIIDPRNGYPVVNGPISVTVVAPDCMTADALATALSVMKPNEGLKLAERLNNIEAIIISKDENNLKVEITSGLKNRYEAS